MHLFLVTQVMNQAEQLHNGNKKEISITSSPYTVENARGSFFARVTFNLRYHCHSDVGLIKQETYMLWITACNQTVLLCIFVCNLLCQSYFHSNFFHRHELCKLPRVLLRVLRLKFLCKSFAALHFEHFVHHVDPGNAWRTGN